MFKKNQSRQKRLMKKKFLFSLGLTFLIIIIFESGLIVGQYKIFPYYQIQYVKNIVMNKDQNKFSRYSESYRARNIDVNELVECPKNADLILINGQSNAGSSVRANVVKSDLHVMYFNKNCYKLAEPVLGATGSMSSLTSELASKIDTTKSIIFVNNAWGGSSIKEWAAKDSKISKYTNDNLKYLIANKKSKLKFFIWIHGEDDSFSGINYIDEFMNTKKNIFNKIAKKDLANLITIISQTSICYDTNQLKLKYGKKIFQGSPEDKNLTKQQKQIAIQLKNTEYISSDKYKSDYRYDGCHFNKFGINALTNDLSVIINSNVKKNN